MSQITLYDMSLCDDRLTRFHDPAVGSGVMLLTAATVVIEKHGSDALQRCSFSGIDKDWFCSHLFPCQFLTSCLVHDYSLGELLSYHGDTLTGLDELRVIVHATHNDVPAEQYVHPLAPGHLRRLHQAAKNNASQLALLK
jgi:hypothetical protein